VVRPPHLAVLVLRAGRVPAGGHGPCSSPLCATGSSCSSRLLPTGRA